MIASGQQVGKYQLLTHLGAGHFGTVYQARDVATNSECAVKFVAVTSPSAIPTVLQEAQNLKLCEGKHIVRINAADVLNDSGQLYAAIDMEFLSGGSLQTRVQQNGISFTDALDATRHVLLGLAEAHRRGIIHRDVKPANVMISGQEYKLSDFGISHIKATATGLPQVYVVNASPETLSASITNELTDIYAAGMMLYRLCLLRGDVSVPIAQIQSWQSAGFLSPLPSHIGIPMHLPRRVKSVILKATAIDPADRYQTTSEMLTAVEALRVAMPWERVDANTWRADKAGIVHSLEVQQTNAGFLVNKKKNNRREKSACSTHVTLASARNAAAKQVSTTTLQ